MKRILVLFALMSSIPAQTSVLDQLSLFFNNDLQFVQSSLNTITNTFDRTEGEYSKKNNLIIINVTSPYKENYYINDKNIEIHDLDFDQIRTIPLSEIEDTFLINFLRNQSLQTYDIKNIKEDSFKLLKNDKEYNFEFLDKDELQVKFTDNMNVKNIVKFYIKL
ncbi:MAG: LolA family protein [Gammaproteobacteria bacterium]